MPLLKLFFLLPLLGLLGACASSPTIFNQPMPDAPSLSAVNKDIEKHKGSRVRWGGVIASLKNQQDETWIEIVQYELDRRGRPVDGDSQGRFYVKVDGYLEPRDYAIGREMTAVGEVTQKVTQKVGKHNYVYPVVAVSSGEFILWDKLYPYHDSYYYPYYDPFYYDPFFRSPLFYPYFHYGHPWPWGYYRHRYLRYPGYVY